MIANAAFLAGADRVPGGRLAGRRADASSPRTRPPCSAGTAGSSAAPRSSLFFNLCALYYSVARWLFLRDSGRKLLHLDRQLGTPDAALDDLGPHLES